MGAIRYAFLIFFCAISALISLGAPAMAEDYAVTQGYVHSFNNKVSVYSGVFALNKDIDLDTSAYVKYNIDLINPFDDDDGGGDDGEGDDDALNKNRNVRAVSGASAAATAGGSAASDTRHALTGGITHNFANVIGVEAYYEYSREQDYTSKTPTITLKKELFEKNTTLTLGYSRNMDTINGQFLGEKKDRDTDNYFLGLTQVISPVTVAQIGYSRNESKGNMTEGIRLVPLDNTDASTCTAESATCVDENFPGSRTREAYILGVNHYFTRGLGGLLDRSAIHLTARYYEDDWDITSYMGEVEYYKYLDERTVLRLNYRYYDQTRAFFVKDTYTAADVFKTASPQLEEFDTHLIGIKGVYSLFDPMEARPDGIHVGSVEAKYELYSESTGVNAHILMAGLRLGF